MRTRYEYATVRGDAHELNQWGNNGWRIHTMLERYLDPASDDEVTYLVLFERRTKL